MSAEPALNSDHCAANCHALGPLPSEPLDSTISHTRRTSKFTWVASKSEDDIHPQGQLTRRGAIIVGMRVVGPVEADLRADQDRRSGLDDQSQGNLVEVARVAGSRAGDVPEPLRTPDRG